MSHLRRALVVATATAVFIIVPAQAASAGESLFVQQAGGGTLRAEKLVLTGVSRRTVRFEDRPRRTGGILPVSRFVRQWRADFGGQPPNAALVVHDAPANRDVALLELRRPRYDAKRRTLTFAVRRLKQTRSSRLKGFGRRSDGRRVRRFGRAELFIDPSSVDPERAVVAVRVPANGQVTISFTNTTVSYDSDGVLLSNLETPAQQQFATAPGLVFLRSTSMMFESAGAGGLTADVLTAIDPPTGGSVTGTAVVPSGASVTMGFTGQGPHTIRTGPFSIPYPSE